jgi:ParB/RepB/Spo0J family partition protein
MTQAAERDENRFAYLELDSLKPSSRMLRPINQEVVRELERSIETMGVLQPIVVRECRPGYEIVFGNHRVEACRRLGMKCIRAVVREFNEDDSFLARVSENLARNNYVDPIAEAEGYRTLMNRGWTLGSIGQKIGKSDSYVCERLALLDHLHHSTVTKIRTGNLTASHAELLSRIQDPIKQKELADLIVKKRLSVRTLENMLNGTPSPIRVPLENTNRDLCVRIPREFLAALTPDGIIPCSLLMRLRGRTITLENGIAKGPLKKRSLHNTHGATSHVGSRSSLPDSGAVEPSSTA